MLGLFICSVLTLVQEALAQEALAQEALAQENLVSDKSGLLDDR